MNNFAVGISTFFHLIVLVFVWLKSKLSIAGAIAIALIFVGLGAYRIQNIFLYKKDVPVNNALIGNSVVAEVCPPLIKNPQESKTVILRIDDVQGFSWADISKNMINIANEKGIPLVLGVIPIALNEDTATLLYLNNSKCKNEIAIHGYDHKDAEFGELTYEEAMDKLVKGSNIFEKYLGVKTNTFIPPENVISEGAIKAVKDIDIPAISSNEGGQFDVNVSFYNYDTKKMNTPDEIWGECESIFQTANNCIIMIHPQELANPDHTTNTEQYNNYLLLLGKIADANVRVTTFREMINSTNLANATDTVTASTWIADWDYDSTISYVSKNKNIDVVLPILYEVNSSGQIVPVNSKLLGALRDIPNRTKIMPTLVNRVDAKLAWKLLENPKNFETQIASLVSDLERQNFYGLDVDIENIDPSLQKNFNQFITNLKKELVSKDFKLSVTIPIKSEDLNWKVSYAYDWKAIGKAADYVRIMAYDIHNQPNEPGSLIPLSDLEAGIKIALAEVPKEKIVFALPTYGYDWHNGEVKSLQFSDIEKIRTQYKLTENVDKDSNSVFLNYTDEKGVVHEIWYESAVTLKAKMDLLKENGITNISFWRLGNHDPAILR